MRGQDGRGGAEPSLIAPFACLSAPPFRSDRIDAKDDPVRLSSRPASRILGVYGLPNPELGAGGAAPCPLIPVLMLAADPRRLDGPATADGGGGGPATLATDPFLLRLSGALASCENRLLPDEALSPAPRSAAMRAAMEPPEDTSGWSFAAADGAGTEGPDGAEVDLRKGSRLSKCLCKLLRAEAYPFDDCFSTSRSLSSSASCLTLFTYPSRC